MVRLEQQPGKGFGEGSGETVRNVGALAAVLGIFPPLRALLIPGLLLAAGGEIFRRVTKPKQAQFAAA